MRISSFRMYMYDPVQPTSTILDKLMYNPRCDEGCVLNSGLKWGIGNLAKRFPIDAITTGGNAFTRQYVTRVLRSTLQDLGYSGPYAGHSFRRVAATWAREVGLTDAEMQLLGRWESDSYLLYIETSPAALLNTSRRFQRR